MPELKDFPFGNSSDSNRGDFKPWEQRPAPGAGGGGGQSFGRSQDEPPQLERFCQEMQLYDLQTVVNSQIDLAYYPMINRHTTAETDNEKRVTSNQEAWQLFLNEELYDTRRITLTHFHLFEWFPLTPGLFHTPSARQNRENAYKMRFKAQNGRSYFNPYGKADMLRGGIGAVRLRPRKVLEEPHFFMTASSNGVCHEGFPVLIPRRFYGRLKARLLRDGAVPVTLSGEMRYLFDDLPTFFEGHREIPQLYLHVDQIEDLPQPRAELKEYTVSAAISFVGKFDGQEGVYATYATFNPARRDSLHQAVRWLEEFYVEGQYEGVVVTDFDEIQPRFPNVLFGLPDLMAGELNQNKIKSFLQKYGMKENAGQPFYMIYKEINTQGGAYIEGNVNTGGGDFIGRDKVIPGGEE
ncbi:MAG: hypothetical protein HN965_05035 [Anaerolineae bacterium]|jgi:hypothetical protein|nr:hypothetical protein [Anaerolineae bacterium]MBT7990401.1 hypothetical protein [Anaerolineae bacterium]